MPFKYKKWTLYKKEIKTEDGNNKTIYFFSIRNPISGKPCEKPEKYKLKIKKLTGLPYIEKE